MEKRFGPIAFDLAAHSGNKKHERYFAPAEFVEVVEERPVFPPGDPRTVREVKRSSGRKAKVVWELHTPNVDPEAVALDALSQPWGMRGLLWLNPEFGEIAPWAAKCETEAATRHAEITMLVPAAVGSNWYRDHVAPHSDAYLLNGRICFDGKNLFPKDCALIHYNPRNREGTVSIWEWRKDIVRARFRRDVG